MTPSNLPRMLRRADALRLIAPYGVTEAEFDKLIEADVLTRITLHEGGRGYYITAQLRRIIIEPLEQAESSSLQYSDPADQTSRAPR